MRVSILLALGTMVACDSPTARTGAEQTKVAPVTATSAPLAMASSHTSDVLVVNGASQPVPTTAIGTADVNISNTPTVNAAQSGSWSVGITGTPTVNATVNGTVSIEGTPTVSVASLPLATVVNIDDPGRVPYQSTVNNAGQCSGSSCGFSFPAVPAGHRVVVQHIGGIVDFNAVPTNIAVFTGGSVGHVVGFFAPIPNGFLFSAFDQPVLFYVDQLQSATISVFLAGNGSTFSGDGTSQFVTLTGYELDCSVAPCAAIAH